MATKRQKRNDNKYKDHLLCENCNRWTKVDHDSWRDTMKAYRERHIDYVCLCARAKCRRGRPEGLLSVLNDKEMEKVVYG